MEKYKVAAGLPRFVDHGHIVVYRVAHFVGGCGFDELPNSTAHGGTVVNNKESGPVCAGHGGDKLLPLDAYSHPLHRERCSDLEHRIGDDPSSIQGKHS